LIIAGFMSTPRQPAWNGFLHSGQNPTSELAIAIRPLLLDLYPWVETLPWGRDISEHAASWLAWMCIFRSGEPDGLNTREMRAVLRNMSDNARRQLIFWLGDVGQSNDNGWEQLVIPFVLNAWPRERVFRTSASVGSWIGLLDDTKDDFPAVYAAVKQFLVPIEGDSHPFYRFTRILDDEEPITVQHPDATLDLMNTVTPARLTRSARELPQILALIAETEASLTSDPRYLRLIDLVERN
jgi:hypothetical protein